MSLSGHAIAAQSGDTKRLVIFLHGYGSNGADLISLAPYFAQIDPHADFLSPDAPEKSPFSPGGFQWFPIPMIDGSSVEDMSRGYLRSRQILQDYISENLASRGLETDALILVGFSQGTMMSLETGLRMDVAPAGIFGFSGRILFPDLLREELRSKPPVYLAHGESDEVVPVTDSIEAEKLLRELGVKTELVVSPNTPHTISPEGLAGALEFYKNEVLS